jgi:phage recombination protein Bet
MSKELTLTEYTPEQLELIKSTVAKGATNDELKLFLYRAINLGLDPMKPGLIYFIKYGNSPGTVVVGLDGFRSIAAKSGLHSGTERGVTRDDNGKLISAWCKVYRKDWNHPAFEEVPLSEYNTGKALWQKMPETMLKKVAECAALRMAFPDALGGVYEPSEMDQAQRDTRAPAHERARAIEARIEPKPGVYKDAESKEKLSNVEYPPPGLIHEPITGPTDPAKHVFLTGTTRKGKTIESHDRKILESMLKWFYEEKTRNFSPEELQDFEMIHDYLETDESEILDKL